MLVTFAIMLLVMFVSGTLVTNVPIFNYNFFHRAIDKCTDLKQQHTEILAVI